MNKVHIEIGKIIRKQRIKAGMTQLELATKLGYESMQFVSLFERGLSKVPHKVIGKLVVVLKVPEQKIISMLMKEYMDNLFTEIKAGKQSMMVRSAPHEVHAAH